MQDTDEVDDDMDIIDVGDDDLQLVEDPGITTSATATSGEDAADDDDNDWVMVRRPGAQNRRDKREYEDPTKEGSQVDEADFSSPRPYLEKQITITAQKKQKNETASLNRAVLSSDTVDTSSDSDPDKVSGPRLTAERRTVPLNFEIRIPQARAERMSSDQPFPRMTEFMSRWGASGEDN